VLTALPLFWGEGGPADIVNGTARRAPLITLLDEQWLIKPVDVLDAAALGQTSRLLMAQPRGLRPEELVALDEWVRKGGRTIVFADPLLLWPSARPLGDPKRAPPVTLLDPLFSHWGLVLESPAEATDAVMAVNDMTGIGVGMGTWRTTAKNCQVSPDQRWAECRIGKGVAILVADADVLDLETTPENEAAIQALITRLQER
jgi:hypothetical protein